MQLTIADQEVEVHVVQLEPYHDEKVKCETSPETSITPVEQDIFALKFGLRINHVSCCAHDFPSWSPKHACRMVDQIHQAPCKVMIVPNARRARVLTVIFCLSRKACRRTGEGGSTIASNRYTILSRLTPKRFPAIILMIAPKNEPRALERTLKNRVR